VVVVIVRGIPPVLFKKSIIGVVFIIRDSMFLIYEKDVFLLKTYLISHFKVIWETLSKLVYKVI